MSGLFKEQQLGHVAKVVRACGKRARDEVTEVRKG